MPLSLCFRRGRAVAFGLAAATLGSAANLPEGHLILDSQPAGRFDFGGVVGERVHANLEHWLLTAPAANPGLLEMFNVRDRQPVPQLVPWAGEFIGKYLVSAVQALRLSDDARLRQQVAAVVAAFIATQADDGYLGPFPRDVRLLKNWDLWGHYHAIYALLLWHEHSGDHAALEAARRAGDLVCHTYLGTGRRVIEAGDPEMNMAILTGLTLLHRRTGEPRYLQMAREVERDWQQAGDYLRSGLDGREFFQTPRPRWESLHDLQGLVELWRVTGDAQYRDAFIHHWRSIRRWDRRNTGGFSSGEQATGNPYAPTAIETCCTVAWMALTLDYLKLTGDARAADDLEVATFNGGLGAQHPSGRWWTYNTPMDGVREASAHTIVFQARAGTPELNCCSVNAPRVLGVLSEWAVMSASDGLALNWYGPLRAAIALADGAPVVLEINSQYPVNGDVTVRVDPPSAREFALHLRIPQWAVGATAQVNDLETAPVRPGTYQAIKRRWQPGDVVTLRLPIEPVRIVPGANEAAGRISIYRGPLLLAYDQRFNTFDDNAIPPVARIGSRIPDAELPPTHVGRPQPWVMVQAEGAQGERIRLVDFATAGSTGTRYRSWLPAAAPLPPPAQTQLPFDGQPLPPSRIRFQWRGERKPTPALTGYRVRIFPAGADVASAVVDQTVGPTNRLELDFAREAAFAHDGDWLWQVDAIGPAGEGRPDAPPARFRVDRNAPAQDLPPEPKLGPAGEIIVHSLRGEAAPEFGTLLKASYLDQDAEGTEVNGRDQMLVYSVPVWPTDDFTVAVRVFVRDFPKDRLGQVFSAWSGAMDDPLRLVIDGGRVFARIESGRGVSTPGAGLLPHTWHAIAAVKRDDELTIYLDGQSVGSCGAPGSLATQARDCALGGNPHFGGNEFLAARFADFRFYGRALAADEIAALSSKAK